MVTSFIVVNGLFEYVARQISSKFAPSFFNGYKLQTHIPHIQVKY